MTMTSRLDPELVAPLEAWLNATKGGINLHDIPAARRMMDELAAAQMAKAQPIEGVSTDDRQVPGPEGAPNVFVRLYQPTDRPATLPALLWIHGGDYVLGSFARGAPRLVCPHDYVPNDWVPLPACPAVLLCSYLDRPRIVVPAAHAHLGEEPSHFGQVTRHTVLIAA